MNELLGMLTQLGFGEYEARAYVALLQHSPANGYELARQSGVPRGSIYAALDRLEERGAAVRLDTADGTRYAAVPADEVLRRVAGGFQRTLGRLGDLLANLSHPPEVDYVWNAHGYGALVDQARSLAESAEARLMVATWPQESAALSEQTAGAVERGVRVSTLCLAHCAQECGHCRGRIYRYPTRAEPGQRWLIVVPDGREVLTAEIEAATLERPEPSAAVVRTRRRLLIDLAESYILQSTALAAITQDPERGLWETLSPDARAALDSLDPDAWAGALVEPVRPGRDESVGPTTD